MNRFRIEAAALAALVVLLVAAPVLAAEVRLTNGDRLTGRLVKLDGEKLTLSTDYAGDIPVDRSRLSCISSDRDQTFRLSDNTVVRGRVDCLKDGTIRIRESATGRARRLALAELQAVNPPPTLRYSGSLTAGGSAATGNTNSRSLYGSGRLKVRESKHRIILDASGQYAESDDTLTARNASGSAKYDYFLTEKLFAYGQTLLEQDRLQDLNLRATFGAGLGYQFFDTDRLGLYTEAGLSHVDENYENAENRSYASGRWSVSFDWQIVPDRIKFFHLHEGYVRADDTADFYIRSQQGLRFTLIDNFFCSIEADYDYKNKPAPGKKNADLKYLLGLGYEFSN